MGASATPPRHYRHHAVCITGLQRSFPWISGNVRKSLDTLYLEDEKSRRSEGLGSAAALFGVRPEHDPWDAVRTALPPLTNETLQRSCGYKAPKWFSVYARSGSARVGFESAFIMSLCDMAICLEDLVVPYETRIGRRFRTLARLRLDLAWETALRMPLGGLQPHAIHAPRMNTKAGINDKWAVGLRAPMGAYLSRVHAIGVANRLYNRSAPRAGQMTKWDCKGHPGLGGEQTECRPRLDESTLWQGASFPVGGAVRAHDHAAHNGSVGGGSATGAARDTRSFAMSSEAFLQWAVWRHNVTVMHMQSWMFCKYKDAARVNNTPRTCVPRLRKHVPCRSLVCTGSAVDCACRNATCTTYDKKNQRNQTSWYCADVAGEQIDEAGVPYGFL